MSEPRVIVDTGTEDSSQVIIGIENSDTSLVAALSKDADEETVDELLDSLETELKHSARIKGGRFA